MTRVKIGERVGAISHSMGNEAFFFGFGKYVGLTVPREAGGMMAKVICEGIDNALEELKALCEKEGKPFEDEEKKMLALIGNPRIELDNGNAIYGCECWWGPEAQVQKQLSEFKKVNEVDIVEYRKRASGAPS